jgi:hypothetical protein
LSARCHPVDPRKLANPLGLVLVLVLVLAATRFGVTWRVIAVLVAYEICLGATRGYCIYGIQVLVRTQKATSLLLAPDDGPLDDNRV